MAHSHLTSILFTSFLLTTLSSAQVTFIDDDDEPFVGVNIGTAVSDLLSPADLVEFLKFQRIGHVRLYDADPEILQALAGTRIRVAVGVPNNQLLAIGSSNATAAAWISRNVVAHYPQTLIEAVAVGDEVLSVVPSSAPLLLPAMESLHQALVAANLHTRVKVSTPHAASILLDLFPPSQAYFNPNLTRFISPILQFLDRTGSSLMMNLFPYRVFTDRGGVVPVENALFEPLTPAKEMVDPNTLLHYTNVLDAMIDAAYFAMKNLNFSEVPVLVSETGWPSKSDRSDRFATVDHAATYNSNLIRHVLDRTGTPVRPGTTPSVYIFELFNEDLRLLSEANWGLFYGNATAVYLLHVAGSGGLLGNDTTNRTYCVAMDGVDLKAVQAALDWACGPGRANCSEIQPGKACYEPNSVRGHASFAFDSYYQKAGRVSGSCDFKGVAMITTTDPSHGSCIFPGSQKVASKTRQVMNSTHVRAGASRTKFVSFRVLLIFCSVLFFNFYLEPC